ncbi:MAG: FlgD immunoglobulin-like domain containing protein [Candidatus Zixiibacteriota bacterium]
MKSLRTAIIVLLMALPMTGTVIGGNHPEEWPALRNRELIENELPGSNNVITNSNSPVYDPHCYDDFSPGFDIRINDDTVSSTQPQRRPSIAANKGGGFIVLWEDARYVYFYQFYIQAYDSEGTPIECNRPLPIPAYGDTYNAYGRSPIASDKDGNFAVTTVFSGYVIAQWYFSDGTPRGPITIVNDVYYGDRYNSSIVMAPDGRSVIVWEDERNSLYDDIYGQMFDPDGNPVGTNFRINDDTGICDQWSSAVAMDENGGFSVVWQDGRNDYLEIGVDRYNDSTEVFFQRFDASGSPVGSNVKVNDEGTSILQRFASIDSDSTGNVTVVWEDSRFGLRRIYAQHFDADGDKVGANMALDSMSTSGSWGMPRVILQENREFVVVAQSSISYPNMIDLGLLFFDSSGLSLGSCIIPHDSVYLDQQYADIAESNDGNILLVWEDHCFGSFRNNGDIVLQRFTQYGWKLGSNQRVNNDDAPQFWPSVAANDDGLVIVSWDDERYRDFPENREKICVQRSSNGTLDGDNIDVSGPDRSGFSQAVAVNQAGSAVVIWSSIADTSGFHRFYRYLDEQGRISDSVSRLDDYTGYVGGSLRRENKAAASGSSFFLVWTEFREPLFHVYGQIIDSTGNRVGQNIRVDHGIDAGSQKVQSVCGSVNNSFVTVWSGIGLDGTGLYLRRFDSLGLPKSDGIKFTGSGTYADCDAYSDGGVLAAWIYNSGGDTAIFTQRISPSDQLIGNVIRVSPAGASVSTYAPPSVAILDNGTALVTWQVVDPVTSNEHIFGRLLDSSGNFKGDEFIFTDTMFAGKRMQSPDVASTGQGFFAAWMDARRDMGWDIYGRYIDMTPTDVADEPSGGIIPGEYSLLQNYPNPFNPTTVVEYGLSKRGNVNIEIFNTLGQKVRTLVNEVKSAGSFRIVWDGTDDRGTLVASGVYLYRLAVDGAVQSKKMILVK